MKKIALAICFATFFSQTSANNNITTITPSEFNQLDFAQLYSLTKNIKKINENTVDVSMAQSNLSKLIKS